MASVGHIAVGMAAARVYHDGRTPRWSSMAAWSAVSLLPDADVIGFTLGVEYADPWGHRGATHSLPMAAALGLAIGLAARWLKRPVRRTALFAGVVLASHGMLEVFRTVAPNPGCTHRSGLLLAVRRGHRRDGTGALQSPPALCAPTADTEEETRCGQRLPCTLVGVRLADLVQRSDSGLDRRVRPARRYRLYHRLFGSSLSDDHARGIRPGRAPSSWSTVRGELVLPARESTLPARHRDIGFVARRVPRPAFRSWRRRHRARARRLQKRRG